MLHTDHHELSEVLPRSYQEDIVDGLYKIHVDRTVNELSNQFCRYYFATNLQTEKEYFAIVFERSFNPSIHAIETLKKHPISQINKLLSYSLIKLSTSRKYQFAVIVEAYDPFTTLQNHIEANGALESAVVEGNLVPSLIRSIEYCKIHDINCGNINPQNIIVTRNNEFILREPISALPNFYQPPAYLAPELADTMQNGRVRSGVSADIYAFGMTIYYSISGVILNFSQHDARIFNAKRIEEGTYEVASSKSKIPKILRILLASTMNDSPLYRWDNVQLCDWLSAQSLSQYKMPAKSNISGHTILFEGYNYSNPAALASAMYVFYEQGLKLCRDENFVKWVQKAKGKADHVEEFVLFTHSNNSYSGTIDAEKEEKMLKVFAMLDPCSPLKTKDLCITLESLPSMLFSAVYGDNRPLLDQISRILRRNYWKTVLTSEYREHISRDYIDQITDLASTFTANTSDYVSKQQLYLLDPYIPCLSPTVIEAYVLSISDLLVVLDKIAAHTPSKLAIDEHIAAFVSSRLHNQASLEEKLHEEPEHLSKSVMLKGVSLLAIAQENSNGIKIPHLCSIVAQKLIEWINDNLHSMKLKKIITSEIAELSAAGSLSQMLYVISNPQLFQNDYRGYKVAYRQAMDLTDKINYLSDEETVRELGTVLGQKLTVLFAYFLCMLVSLMLVI